jgi:hypothetical protein
VSVLLWLTASDYPVGIFDLRLLITPLCCLSFVDLRLLITPLVSCGHCSVCPSLTYGFWLFLWYLLAIVVYVLLWLTASDYSFGIFELRLLITPLVSLTYAYWLLLWYLWLTASDYPFGIFDLRLLITPSVYLTYASDYPFGIFDLRLLIAPLVSLTCGFWLPLWYLWLTASDYSFGIFDLRLLITPFGIFD